MQIRFLLGPAGSGKTFRCLAEIREELLRSPEGPPLILLAPKQATFQLERQLLDFPGPETPRGGSRARSPRRAEVCGLQGYTRLHILSFERLAEFLFGQLGRPVPELLGEQGRVMVLRALLEQKRSELEIFRASARLPGFARQMSQFLRDLQQQHLTPKRLEALAENVGGATPLDAKLRDLALIWRAYCDWLNRHQLEDADALPDLAAEALRAQYRVPGFELRIAGLWLDGFAQLTPQERRLLGALAELSGRCTLAFCLDTEPAAEAPWHSIWAPITEAFLRCRDEFRAIPGADIKVEVLAREAGPGRFREPLLRQLERSWGKSKTEASYALEDAGQAAPDHGPQPGPGNPPAQTALRLFACANPEAEAECVAREIRRRVREDNGRYRDMAVLVRSLDPYHDPIRRIFTRYEIPFFLDRRESVAHHPLAEVTRYALRVVVHGWEHDDWFGALKTGLVHDDDAALDRLENEALARGWRGRSRWLEPIILPEGPDASEGLERLRRKLVAPFDQFWNSLAAVQRAPTGAQLSDAVRDFWRALKADRELARWHAETNGAAVPEQSPMAERESQIHESVWEQMREWLRNLELAFPSERLSLNDWLPVVEAGLADLSVGVVPPALDQVLVGAVDRSRNPDLQIAFVVGMNEGVFPAAPPAPPLLNRSDREALASRQAAIGPDFHRQMGLERFYGYIACTRARRGLVLTYSHRDAESGELNPSSFISELQRLVPGLKAEEFDRPTDWGRAEHWNELIVSWLQNDGLSAQPSLVAAAPGLQPVADKWRQMANARQEGRLPPELVERIYGRELRTSVSGLEDFAACPFKFFAGRGLRAEERQEFEIDPRQRGSFQHEVLKEFHLRLQREGRRWRDISPGAAQALVREVGEALLPAFREGLLTATESRRFAARLLIEGLESLIQTLVHWAGQYQFDPVDVETSFGLEGSGLPAWRIDLDGKHALLLRGRIDRIDLCPGPAAGQAFGVVIDYKSSPRQLDEVMLRHGLELQLPAYLGALATFEGLGPGWEGERIIPAGAFYVALTGGGGSVKTRDAELEGREEARHAGSQHRGRFDGGQLEKFDRRGPARGDQFRYARNKDGSFARRGNEALDSEDFRALVKQIENFLRQHGRAIYQGDVAVAPYRWKTKTACDFCRYRPVCRFDPWTQPYRVLRPLEKGPADS